MPIAVSASVGVSSPAYTTTGAAEAAPAIMCARPFTRNPA